MSNEAAKPQTVGYVDWTPTNTIRCPVSSLDSKNLFKYSFPASADSEQRTSVNIWQLLTSPGTKGVAALHFEFNAWLKAEGKICTIKTRNAYVTEFVSSRKVANLKPGSRVKHARQDKFGVIRKHGQCDKWLVEWDTGYTQLLGAHLLKSVMNGSRSSIAKVSDLSAYHIMYRNMFTTYVSYKPTWLTPIMV